MSPSLLIAIKFLREKKRFSFSSLLSLLCLTLGVTGLIAVLSVVNGFKHDMVTRITGNTADIKIYKKDYQSLDASYITLLSDLKNVVGIAPANPTELIIRHGNDIFPTTVTGISLNEYGKVSSLLTSMRLGNPDTLSFKKGIILGQDLSFLLKVTVGEYVQLSSAMGEVPTPFGLLPKTVNLKVVGIFSAGFPEYDQNFSFVDLAALSTFTGQGIKELHVKTKDPFTSIKVAKEIAKILPENYLVEDWSVFEKNLFSAMQLEKMVMFFVLTLMIVLAAFNLGGNLMKIAVEKRTSLGILQAQGLTASAIRNIFLYAGLIIGSLGVVAGLAISSLLIWLQSEFHLLSIPVDGFPLKWLPVHAQIGDYLIVSFTTLLICAFTSFYPALKFSSISIIEVLRDK